MMLSSRARAASLASLVVLASAACFPGARAPNVAPARTLSLSAGELGAKAAKGPFAVVFAGPKGATVDPSEVSLVFNRPLRPLQLAGEESPSPAKIIAREAKPPEGAWRWLGTNALSFIPTKALARATEYEVSVPASTKALDGSVLGKDFVFTFTTPGPRLVGMTPSDGSSHLKPTQDFELRFNQPVDPKEVERAVHLDAGEKPAVHVPFKASRPKPDVPMLVKIVPQKPLPLDSSIAVVVDASLKGLEGPLPAGSEHTMTVQTYGPLAATPGCSSTENHLCSAHGTLEVSFSNRVSYKDVAAHVRIDPPLAIKWPKRRADEKTEWVSIPVDVPPARTFRVTVTAGIRDEFGQVLARDAVKVLTSADERPSVDIGLTGDVLELAKAKGRDVPVTSVNVPSYTLVSAAATEEDVVSLFRARRQPYGAMFATARSIAGAKVEEVKPSAARNTQDVHGVSIDARLAGTKGKGALVVATSRPGPRAPDTSVQLVSVTDLALTAKLSRFGSVVLVTRLSDGKPVANATVAARGPDGAQTMAAATDANGLAVLGPDRFQPIGVDGELDDGLVLFARSGDDWTFRNVADTVSRADMPSLDLAARMAPFGMLFTDRGIYKPGETIHVKGVFRRPNPKNLGTPRGHDVTITAQDPQGGTMFEGKGKLGPFGEIAIDVPIPAASRLGHVSIEANLDGEEPRSYWQPNAASAGVEVAAYRPAEFKVAVEPNKPSYIRGDKASFVVRGDYLFGAPMSGGKVRYSVTRSRTWFSPPGLDGFAVDDEAYSWALPDGEARGGKIQSGDGVIDGKGTYAADVALALPKQQGPETVSMEAEIEDLSRQTIASQSAVVVHPGEFYVALERPKDWFVGAGTPLAVKAAAVDPGGNRRAGVPVQVELIERSWQTVTEETGEWGLHYESRPVDKVVGGCAITTAGTKDAASCDLKLGEAGYFIVRAKAKDRRGNALSASYSVFVTGEGHVAWPIQDGPRLELVADKKSYQVGDEAKILIKNPYNDAEALVTIERQGIQEQRRIEVHGPMPTINVPVTKEMWPNTYVSVELIKPRTAAPKAKGADVGAPAYRIGWAEIAVDPEARRLKVAMKPSRKDFRPGEEVDVDLVVTDRAGKGTRADVAFYAVDEGVLMLTGYATPDPIPVFAAKRQISVTALESRDALAKIMRVGRGPGEDKGDDGGGGGEEGMSVREDFRTTAFFAPSVVTAADGKAHVKFKLPDSLTTFRLMAVATAEDDRFGFGQDQVTTSRPLMARPALPRFLRAGDSVEAGVVLSSKGLGEQTVDVKLDAKGVVVTGETTRSVKLPANGSVEVRWPIAAPTVGDATFSFTAKARAGGATGATGASDAVKVERKVELPLVMEAVALYGDTDGAAAEQLGDLSAMRSDVGGLDVRLTSTALVGLDDGVESLLQYPYGCTEQLTSRMVPLVALVDLARDYAIALPKDPNGAVDAAIAKILKNQRDDGSFGYWPDSIEGDTWLTAYALWGLSLAKERGRVVPADAMEAATTYLRRELEACGLGSGGGASSGSAKRPVKSVRRSFACDQDDVMLAAQTFVVDVLAMTGKADAGYTNQLFERRDKMPLFARALLAHAMLATKMRPEDVKLLVEDAENHLRVTGAGATVAENFGDKYAPLLDSEARTTAIVLRTLITMDPKHPLAGKLAKGLLAARRGGSWRSTQENAWALLALDGYRKAQEATVPDFDAVAFAGETELFRAPFHGRSMKAESREVSAARLLERPGQTLAFQVDGRGKLFYEARLRYAKKELPTVPIDRGFFVKKIVRSVRPEGLSEALRILPQDSARAANASDLVLVDLLVVTPDPREQVVIDDPLPAGLEPVQAKLATTAHDLDVTEPGAEGDEGDADAAQSADERATGRAYQSSWYHREFHDDRVLTFVDHMAAGMYHYRYLARATTIGKFVVPPTKAECMYEPETFGRTGATAFEVKQ